MKMKKKEKKLWIENPKKKRLIFSKSRAKKLCDVLNN